MNDPLIVASRKNINWQASENGDFIAPATPAWLNNFFQFMFFFPSVLDFR